MMASSTPLFRRLAAGLALACTLAGCMLSATQAGAAESMTGTIEGISYTVPANWDEIDLRAAVLEGIEDNRAALSSLADGAGTQLGNPEEVEAALDELPECVAYGRGDGHFAAVAIPQGMASSMPASAEELDAAATYLSGLLAFTPLSGLEVTSTTLEDASGVSWPALSASTTDVTFNGVTYEAKLLVVMKQAADFEGYVLMVSIMPTSGQVNENVMANLPETTDTESVDVGGASYTLPAGTQLGLGTVFGSTFTVAQREDAHLVAANVQLGAIASLALAGGGSWVSHEDVVSYADELVAGYDEGRGVSSGLEAFSAEGLDINGAPTLDVNATAPLADGDITTTLRVSLPVGGVGVLVFWEPAGGSFAAEALSSAQPAQGADGEAATSSRADAVFSVGA